MQHIFLKFIYWLNPGEVKDPNGLKVIVNINEFSGSNSESL